MREALFRQPLYWLARGFVYLCLLVKYRMRVFGREHVPARGGAIIAANHCSYLDPPVMGGANSRRVVHFLARDTLLSNPIAKWFFPRVAVIPLDRTKGDLGALKKAIAILKEGRVVGLFPEGTRSPDGRMRAAKGGIGFLIAKSEVPVVPLHISGTFAAFPRARRKCSRRGSWRATARPFRRRKSAPRCRRRTTTKPSARSSCRGSARWRKSLPPPDPPEPSDHLRLPTMRGSVPRSRRPTFARCLKITKAPMTTSALASSRLSAPFIQR